MDMDINLEDLIATGAANNAKTSKKFQPKGKPKPKPKPDSQPEPKPTPTPSTQLVEVAAATEEKIGNDVNQIIGNVIDSLQVSSDIPEEDTNTSKLDAGVTEPGLIDNINSTTNLESMAELESKSTPSPLTQLVEVATAIEDQVGDDVNQIVGNVLDGLQVSSEEPEEEARKLDAGPTDHGLINNIDACTNIYVMFNAETDSGPKVGKLKPKPKPKPKPKARRRKLDEILNTPDENAGPVPVPTQASFMENKSEPNAHSRELEEIPNTPDENVGPAPVPTQTNFMENELVPSFTPEEILGTSPIQITDSVHPTETISDYHANQEPFDSAETSRVDSVNKAGRSSKRSRKPSAKALQTIVEAENEDDYVPENEYLTQRKETNSKSNAKQSLNENKKPARKRKKAREVSDEVVEVPKKKKFSHSTRRNKRPVNPELLKIPEDEFELHMHNFPLKELIRLREHRERLEKKEAASLETQGEGAGQSDDHLSNGGFYNYGTYMKITPRMRWTKQDTELFYEAIKQFGTDFSMIKERFPGRTREQMKLKYKKESKQNGLRMQSALNTRVKGHSHYEFLIEQLKKAQEEDSENFDSAGEEDEEAVAADVNEGGGGDVAIEKAVKDTEPDAVAAESPTKSDDIENDDTWCHYKSEI